MNHKGFTNRADLLEAAAHSIRMQEAAGIEPLGKAMGDLYFLAHSDFSGVIENYEFPLAVVEGKPVFEGDELYVADSECLGYGNKTKIAFGHNVGTHPKRWSWNQPKPRTVMVEMLVEDAEFLSYPYTGRDEHFRISSSCRKALEAQASLTVENKND